MTTYSFTYDVSCFCAGAALTPVRVRVADGEVVSVESLEDAEPVEASRLGFGHSLTVEGLFGYIESRLLERPDDVDVRYDDEFGFPILAFFDVAAEVSDDEVTITVRGLAANVPAQTELLTVVGPAHRQQKWG